MVGNRVTRVFIGTSGWQYSHWRGNFYPQNLPSKDWLSYYSNYFNTVEVNSSFYRQTRASTFEKWKSEVPRDFVFSVKGNRFITHIKRLKNCEESIKEFFENTKSFSFPQPSDQRLEAQPKNVILWQLPPSLKKDIGRLKDFLGLLPGDFRHAFEFRHKSWLDKETITSLVYINDLETTVVFQDWSDWPLFEDFINSCPDLLSKFSFVYIRFHGKKQLYTSGYSQEELASWSKKVQEWIDQGLDVYAYFNNDALGYAVENARTLKRFVCEDSIFR